MLSFGVGKRSEVRVVSVLGLTLFLLSSTLPIGFAANTPNGKCSTAGKTAKINNAKYICTKSGKKLLWKKGLTSPNSAPIPVPPSAPTDLEKLEIIFSDLKSKMLVAKPNYELSVNVDPQLVDSAWSRESIASIEPALKLWSVLGIPQTKKTSIYISWGTEYLKPFINPGCIGNSGGGMCGAGLVFVDLKWFADNWGYGGSEKPYKNEMDKFSLAANIPHELAHIAQAEVADFSSNFDSWANYPAWLREGGAEYFKLLSYAFDKNVTYKSLRNMYARSGAERCLKIPLTELLGQGSTSEGCEYNKGLFATEYLVLKFNSAESIFTLNKIKNTDGAARFKSAYNIDRDDFLKEADSYFAKVIAGLS